MATVRWLWVMAILWPIGCSVIQPGVPEKIPPTTPAPDSQPQQASPQEVRPLPPPEVKYLNHKIKWSGENLILIARWYTGSANNWKRLVEANPGIDPRRIKIGDSILIPVDLLKTRRPMPIEFLSSATDKKKAPAPPPEAKYLNHKIKWSGENLILIARWYTGSADNWKRLVKANPRIDPRRIKIGDSILIPEDLLKTRRPMPIEFLSSATDKKKEPAPPIAKKAVKSDKIELFGPIDTETQTSGVDDSDSPLPLETIE